MTADEAYVALKVQHRMDPIHIPLWQHDRSPRPFWYDPAGQTVHAGDDRRWTCLPIHDGAWSS